MLGLKMQMNHNPFHHQLEDKTQRKKIEEYSYGLFDKIGTGYSSVVYKGRNDNTGKKHSLVEGSQLSIIFVVSLFRLSCCHQGDWYEGGEGWVWQTNAWLLDWSFENFESSKYPKVFQCIHDC